MHKRGHGYMIVNLVRKASSFFSGVLFCWCTAVRVYWHVCICKEQVVSVIGMGLTGHRL
jgi:hypothetical protein